MKTILVYLKFFTWSIINSAMIIILAGIISSLFGIEHILFIGKLLKEGYINFFVFTGLFKLIDIAIMSLATIPILTSTYLLTKSDIKENWKSLAIATSFGIFLFAFSCPYIFNYVCYDLFNLTIVIVLNIYIIYKLLKTKSTSTYKFYAFIFLTITYIYLIGLNLKLYSFPI